MCLLRKYTEVGFAYKLYLCVFIPTEFTSNYVRNDIGGIRLSAWGQQTIHGFLRVTRLTGLCNHKPQSWMDSLEQTLLYGPAVPNSQSNAFRTPVPYISTCVRKGVLGSLPVYCSYGQANTTNISFERFQMFICIMELYILRSSALYEITMTCINMMNSLNGPTNRRYFGNVCPLIFRDSFSRKRPTIELYSSMVLLHQQLSRQRSTSKGDWL